MNLYHITTRKAWIEASRRGQYSAPSLAEEGYIHCSTARQVLAVARQFYSDQSGLVLLVIDPARLTAPVKWERPAGGVPPQGVPDADTFPHVHGPINLEAVLQALDFQRNEDGEFMLPPSVLRNGSAGSA